MDFERATIKALFYDYPIETALEVLNTAEKKEKDVFLDILPQLLRWREQSFTTTESGLMNDLLEDKWLKENEGCTTDTYNKCSQIYRPFLFVRTLAEKMLIQNPLDHGNPTVCFQHLFRWNDITLFLGEDLFTTAFVAARDAKNPLQHTDNLMLWQDKIKHNESLLNEVLDRGLSDVHAHFNATADIFHYNWVNLMNSIRNKNKINKIGCSQDLLLFSQPNTENIIPYNRLCIAAAYLRVLFFKKFVLNSTGTIIADFRKVKRIFTDELYAQYIYSDIQAEIDVLRFSALHTPRGHAIDYAILNNRSNRENRDNVNMFFQGERELMYSFLLRYYEHCKDAWCLAPYFYLYILIKTRIRREFVQINQLVGFENFQTYQDRKGQLVDSNDILYKEYAKIAYQTSVRGSKGDYLEARISPNALKKQSDIRKQDFTHSIFSDKQMLSSQRLTFVTHFIKAGKKVFAPDKEESAQNDKKKRYQLVRFASYRKEIETQIKLVLSEYAIQQKYSKYGSMNNRPRIVGIDAAGTEMFCRPEEFAHVYRYAKRKGLYQRTYHVGEDFFDIVDGMRAIDEAITFLELDSYSRIGHALALGVHVSNYYASRKYRIIMPAQYWLDNCIWLLKRTARNNIAISSSMTDYLISKARQMYIKIGYTIPFNLNTYWNSMLLRGHDLLYLDLDGGRPRIADDWKETAWQSRENDDIKDALSDKDATELFRQYSSEEEIRKKGKEQVEDKYPEEIIKVVEGLQKEMRKYVSHLNISIESNPTSNLRIGHFDSYCEHPLLTEFAPISSQVDYSYPYINVSVSTDDRGVFYTSVYNELSLLALALSKQKNEKGDYRYNMKSICEYIDYIRNNGHIQRFKPTNNSTY